MSEVRSNEQWAAGQPHESLVAIGDPRLNQPVHPLAEPTAHGGLFTRMISLLRELNGAGLAAPQIGEPVAAIVIEIRRTNLFPDRPPSPLIAMANPELVDASEEVVDDWEGCFSIPGLMGRVPRHRHIQVRYITPEGQQREDKFSGYMARVIQHELDHLAAVTFIQRIPSMDTLTTVGNYLRFHQRPDS